MLAERKEASAYRRRYTGRSEQRVQTLNLAMQDRIRNLFASLAFYNKQSALRIMSQTGKFRNVFDELKSSSAWARE